MARVTHFAGGTLLHRLLDTPEEWFAAMDAAGQGLDFLPKAKPNAPPTTRASVRVKTGSRMFACCSRPRPAST